MILLKKFLLPVRKEFDAFKLTPEVYAGNVQAISNNLNLHKPKHLHHKELPSYWAGDLTGGKEKIAIVEMNTAFDAKKMAFENRFKNSTWDNYLNFHNNLFQFYKKRSEWPLKYYKSLSASLSKLTFRNREHLDFLHENVVRFDILPYVSSDINKTSLCKNAGAYLFGRFNDHLLPFLLRNKKIKKAIFHNRQLTNILLQNNFISADDMIYVRMNKGRNLDFIYKKNYPGLEIFIFSRSIPFGGFMKSEVYKNVFD
jgi:hypothetical protein